MIAYYGHFREKVMSSPFPLRSRGKKHKEFPDPMINNEPLISLFFFFFLICTLGPADFQTRSGDS